MRREERRGISAANHRTRCVARRHSSPVTKIRWQANEKGKLPRQDTQPEAGVMRYRRAEQALFMRRSLYTDTSSFIARQLLSLVFVLPSAAARKHWPVQVFWMHHRVFWGGYESSLRAGRRPGRKDKRSPAPRNESEWAEDKTRKKQNKIPGRGTTNGSRIAYP